MKKTEKPTGCPANKAGRKKEGRRSGTAPLRKAVEKTGRQTTKALQREADLFRQENERA